MFCYVLLTFTLYFCFVFVFFVLLIYLSSVNVLTLFEYLNTNQKWKIQTENYLCSHLFLRFKIRQCVYFVCVCLQKSSRTIIHLVYLYDFTFFFNNSKIENKRNEFCIYIYRFYIGGSIINFFHILSFINGAYSTVIESPNIFFFSNLLILQNLLFLFLYKATSFLAVKNIYYGFSFLEFLSFFFFVAYNVMVIIIIIYAVFSKFVDVDDLLKSFDATV